MGSQNEHLQRAEHNEGFSERVRDMDRANAGFNDWEATALFYAAVHLVEACLASKDELSEEEQHPTCHAQPDPKKPRGRNSLIEDEIPLVWEGYRGLYDLSVMARYFAEEQIEAADVDEARTKWYEPLRNLLTA